jgi:hypothetical protein
MTHHHDGGDLKAKHRELKGGTRTVALGIRCVHRDKRSDVAHHKEFTWASVKDYLGGGAGVGAGDDHRARLLPLARKVVISHALIVVATGAEATVSGAEALREGLARHGVSLNEAIMATRSGAR